MDIILSISQVFERTGKFEDQNKIPIVFDGELWKRHRQGDARTNTHTCIHKHTHL